MQGKNAYSFLEDIRTKTDFSGSVASLIDVKKDGFFSGTVSTKFESDKKYSFSTKFSYAKAEVIKKQRRYLIYPHHSYQIFKNTQQTKLYSKMEHMSGQTLLLVGNTQDYINLLSWKKITILKKQKL